METQIPDTIAEIKAITDPQLRPGYYVRGDGQILCRRGDKLVQLAPYWARTHNRGEDGHRYLRVDLRTSAGGRVRRRVHLLVLAAFHGPRPSPAHVARHLDDVRSNNAARNLAWGLPADNMADARQNGRLRGRAKLTPVLVLALRAAQARLGDVDAAIAEIEAVHGPLPCGRGAVLDVLAGRTWRDLIPASTPSPPDDDEHLAEPMAPVGLLGGELPWAA